MGEVQVITDAPSAAGERGYLAWEFPAGKG